MNEPNLPPGFSIRRGSSLDRALLVKFAQRTYQDLYPEQSFGHLATTVEQYFSSQTPLWWLEVEKTERNAAEFTAVDRQAVGCVWLGNAVDQVQGDRYAYIFILYVAPSYRRQGLGAALVHCAEMWAKERGDRQLGLQVFATNQPAINLYEKLGYRTQSLLMVKPLE